MMRMYARIRGLKRFIIPIPLEAPSITSKWVSLITPVRASVARQVIDRLQGELTVSSDLAAHLFNVRLRSYADTVRVALQRFDHDNVETMWSDAVSTSVQDTAVFQRLAQSEGMIVAKFRRAANADPNAVFSVVSSLGGETGWLYANALWRIRGFLDVLVGGVGSRRSRRSHKQLRVGDAVDFWRVETVEENQLLRLRAEMKIPGKAWLQYELSPVFEGRTTITQTAFYEPRGLLGAFYWYLMYLPHKFIFPGILREIARRAENGNAANRKVHVSPERVVESR
ncbi:MAG TPA: SDR family oxidoreductase, partial [Rhodothermia bacterium]|nr:SDR family oxidoreductase [Rhodothermia bacterium]